MVKALDFIILLLYYNSVINHKDMKVNNVLNATAKVADQTGARPILSSVCFKHDRYIATNSYIMFEKFNEETGIKDGEELLVNASELAKKQIPVNSTLDLEKMTLDNKGSAIKLKKVDGEFPETAMIYPEGKEEYKIALGAKLLITLLNAFVQAGGHSDGVVLSFYGESRPVIVTPLDKEISAKGVIMPLRQ